MPQVFPPHIMELARRFQPSGTAQENASLSCDPEGFAKVGSQEREEVDYPRPPFNWPSSASPQANFFVIEGMAVDTLLKCGFSREAASLKARLSLHPPAYNQLPSLLHRYLDLEPANADPSKLATLQAMADDMGLDAGALGQVCKKKINNSLFHKCKTAEEEWAWLVAHAAQTSSFGKTAACELSLPTMLRLVELWLPQIGLPPPLPASDPSFANLAWFRSAFPLGWSHIDHLGESAVVSAPSPENFSSRLALAYFEMSDKISRGWTETDARTFCFAHKNNMDINGAALFAQGAHGHFNDNVLPILLGAPASPRTRAESFLIKHIQQGNPSLARQRQDDLLWLVYRAVDPESSRFIQDIYTDPDEADKLGMSNLTPKGCVDADRPRMAALLERLELAAAGASFWSIGRPVALPAAALAQKRSMRL